MQRLFRAPIFLPMRKTAASLALELGLGALLGLGLGSVRVLLVPLMGSTAPFALVYVAITAATVLAGWRAGLAALLCGQALSWYAVFEPRLSFDLRSPTDLAVIAVTIVAELLVVLAIALYQKEVLTVTAARDEMDAARQTVIDEMNHRVKNTLAVVMGIAGQTLKEDKDGGASAFMARLAALGRAHDLLVKEPSGRASISELIDRCVEPYRINGDERIKVDGPSLHLSRAAAINLALVVNELATNAIKYGALSSPAGTIHLDWSAVEGGVLSLRWRETGGPLIQAPARSGFGTRMIKACVHGKGSANFDFDPDGLRCEISMSQALSSE